MVLCITDLPRLNPFIFKIKLHDFKTKSYLEPVYFYLNGTSTERFSKLNESFYPNLMCVGLSHLLLNGY